MDQRNFVNPFIQRSWMANSGAAYFIGSHTGRKAIIAGGVSGATEICVTYPTEFVKTQLQLEEKGKVKKYEGIIDCVKKTMKKRGFFGLYRGLNVLLYGSIPKSATRFGSFEYFRSHMVDKKGHLNIYGKLLAGFGAGVTEAILIVTPMETIKVRFINDQRNEIPEFKGFVHGIRTIIKNEGFYGIYRGLPPTMLKQGSNQAVRFFVVESLKDLYTNNDRDQPIPKPLVGVFGFSAGASSVLVNNPLDVIKTRMQSLEAAKYKNTLDCCIKVLQNEGLCAYYKGLVPSLCGACLNVSITFMVYDWIMGLQSTLWED